MGKGNPQEGLSSPVKLLLAKETPSRSLHNIHFLEFRLYKS